MSRGRAAAGPGGPLNAQKSADARTWVQAGRASAIERFPYLDVALSSMVIVEATGLGTVATDARWRFYYDPLRVLAIPRAQRLGVMVSDWIHEVGHQLREHPQRWKDTDRQEHFFPLFNAAGDALINHDLAQMHLAVLPTDVTFQTLPAEAGAQPTMTTEEIYHRLRTLVRDPDQAWAPDCGSGAGGGRRPWEMPIGDDAPDDGSTDSAQAELIRHETASQIRSHVRTHGAGSVPHHLRDWAESILDPLVDWRRELRAAVSRGLSQAAGRADYTFSRPPRRRVPGYTTPGMAGPAPPGVAVVVDTSGSMSQDDLAQCIADIAALSRSVSGASGAPAVRVIPCDARAGQVSLVRSRADVPRIRLTGGGGTDMRVGIDAAVNLRPTPDVVVTLTDGYTPWPERAPAAAPRARHIAVVLAEEDVAERVPSWIHTIRR